MAVLMRAIFHILLSFLIVTLGATALASDAGNIRLYEKKIQSGLVYNFLKYTEWPTLTAAATDQPFRVCVFGDRDPFEGHLNPISGRTAQQRKIVLQFITRDEHLEDCHLLVVSSDAPDDVRRALNLARSRSILTISDAQGFARAGGMVEFARKNGNIAVNINKRAVDSARLKINDRMLALANVVY